MEERVKLTRLSDFETRRQGQGAVEEYRDRPAAAVLLLKDPDFVPGDVAGEKLSGAADGDRVGRPVEAAGGVVPFPGQGVLTLEVFKAEEGKDRGVRALDEDLFLAARLGPLAAFRDLGGEDVAVDDRRRLFDRRPRGQPDARPGHHRRKNQDAGAHRPVYTTSARNMERPSRPGREFFAAE